jgi:hypothetical protein
MKEVLRSIFASKMGVYIFLSFVLVGLMFMAKELNMLEQDNDEK